MFEQDDIVTRVIRQLRRTPPIDPGFDERVMATIAALPKPTARRRIWGWWGIGLATAAALGALFVRPWMAGPADAGALEFVLVAPRATSVALVGDFNDWDPARTPMRPSRNGAAWATEVALAPGRYRYAFLVNGREWRADPAAPRVVDDEFGTPSSVVTVAGEGRGS
ncbi:MAG: isoamylase early set domain-containing protein [Gemmatimonadales bacterium]